MMDESTKSFLLQYTRFHGVGLDHQSIDPLKVVRPLLRPHTFDYADNLRDPIINPVEWHYTLHQKLKNEKLDLSKDCGRFLSSLLNDVSTYTRFSDFDLTSPLRDYHKVKRLKVPSPHLELRFGSKLLDSGRSPSLDFVTSCLRELNTRQKGDEGLEFPDYFEDLSKEVWQEVNTERLSCSRDTLRFIQQLRDNENALDWRTDFLTTALIRLKSKPISSRFDRQNGLASNPDPPCSDRFAIHESPASVNVSNGLQQYTQVTLSSALDDTHIICDRPESPFQGCQSMTTLTKNRALNTEPPGTVTSLNLSSTNEPKVRKDIDMDCQTSPKNDCLFSPSPKTSVPQDSEPRPDAELVDIALQTIQATVNNGNPLLTPRYSVKSGNSPKFTNPCTKGTAERSEEGKRLDISCGSLSISPSMGNLLSYMETRGKRLKKRPIELSPYFGESLKWPQIELPQDDCLPASPPTSRIEEVPLISNAELLLSKVNFRRHRAGKPLTLVLSTSLLQSDREILRELEYLPEGSKLIYRECGSHRPPLDSKGTLEHCLAEADIIVSPGAGVILTTSQETTQRHLPGYKPRLSGPTSTPVCASPLQERVLSTCLRYDRLYVLIRLPVEKHTPSSKDRASTSIDAKMLSAIKGLHAFCHSLHRHSTVIPCLVPCSPCSVADTICSMAMKQFDIIIRQPSNLPALPADSESYPATPGEERIYKIPITLDLFIDEVTQWEMFLCQAGLNPLAAQTVLGVMERVYAQQQQGDSADGRFHPDIMIERAVDADCSDRTLARGCSAFIELSAAERACMFDSIVGKRVMLRVSQLLDRMWFM